ncbi:MAG: hypothetical protein ACI4GD_08930 [Lachnospiraceae bacterium]
MFYYIKEYCSPYYQLMPVEYKKKEDGQWHKVGMACNSDPNCQTPVEECKHYKIAPEVVPVDQLRETRL